MSAHCELTLFYPVFGTKREGCLFINRTHFHCSHFDSLSLFDDMEKSTSDKKCPKTLLPIATKPSHMYFNVIFMTSGSSNQEVCRNDRQDVGRILFKRPQILKIASCLYDGFILASFVWVLILQLHIQNTALQLYLNNQQKLSYRQHWEVSSPPNRPHHFEPCCDLFVGWVQRLPEQLHFTKKMGAGSTASVKQLGNIRGS